MTDAERVEAALNRSNRRAVTRDWSEDKETMLTLAIEVWRLRDFLANEVKHHVQRIDQVKELTVALERAQAELAQEKQDCHDAKQQLDKAEARVKALDQCATELQQAAMVEGDRADNLESRLQESQAACEKMRIEIERLSS